MTHAERTSVSALLILAEWSILGIQMLLLQLSVQNRQRDPCRMLLLLLLVAAAPPPPPPPAPAAAAAAKTGGWRPLHPSLWSSLCKIGTCTKFDDFFPPQLRWHDPFYKNGRSRSWDCAAATIAWRHNNVGIAPAASNCIRFCPLYTTTNSFYH